MGVVEKRGGHYSASGRLKAQSAPWTAANDQISPQGHWTGTQQHPEAPSSTLRCCYPEGPSSTLQHPEHPAGCSTNKWPSLSQLAKLLKQPAVESKADLQHNAGDSQPHPEVEEVVVVTPSGCRVMAPPLFH